MSLVVMIGINDADPFGFVTVRRITNKGRVTLKPDQVSKYEVKVGDRGGTKYETVLVDHRYGDGALVLLRKALDAAIPLPQEEGACNL